MTTIARPVKRISRESFMHYRRNIVVILEPGDVIAMRLKGTRTTYRIALSDLFTKLAHWHGLAESKRKREEKRNRRK